MKRFILISAAAVVLTAAAAVPFGLEISRQNVVETSPKKSGTAISETYETVPKNSDLETEAANPSAHVSFKKEHLKEPETAETHFIKQPSETQKNKIEQKGDGNASSPPSSINEKQKNPTIFSQTETHVPVNKETEPKATIPPVSEVSKPKPIPAPTQPNTYVTEHKATEPAEQRSYTEQVVDLVNQERKKAGLQPLSINRSAETAAQIRAKEIEKSFSHTRPNGSSFSTALTEQGIRYRSSGENIAWGQKTPQQVMDGWMNSSGHRANILNKKFTSIGVGYYKNATGVNYWTQLFIG